MLRNNKKDWRFRRAFDPTVTSYFRVHQVVRLAELLDGLYLEELPCDDSNIAILAAEFYSEIMEYLSEVSPTDYQRVIDGRSDRDRWMEERLRIATNKYSREYYNKNKNS